MENGTSNEGGSQPPAAVPGVKDSMMLLVDSLLTLLLLGKSEAAQILAFLPQLLELHLCRLPVLLLTWISFGVLVACSVYTYSENLVFSAGSFFVLQVGMMLVLERRLRRLREQMDFPETRKGLTALQLSVKQRFGNEAG
ncbi:MAG: hypothetical protein V4603_01780 [Pseudomonadota bacterium]